MRNAVWWVVWGLHEVEASGCRGSRGSELGGKDVVLVMMREEGSNKWRSWRVARPWARGGSGGVEESIPEDSEALVVAGSASGMLRSPGRTRREGGEDGQCARRATCPKAREGGWVGEGGRGLVAVPHGGCRAAGAGHPGPTLTSHLTEASRKVTSLPTPG